MNISEIVKSRYSTKEFDAEKKIPAELFEQIKTLLRYSPSSVNSQPWHFIIAESDEAKKRISKGTQDTYSFNEAKILDASHVILFCSRNQIDEEYMLHLLETEDKDGRYAEPTFKDMVHGGRTMFVNLHRYDLKDVQHWMEKQVYLNMGTVLLGAAALGLDALPIEGIDQNKLDEEFGLRDKGFTSVAAIALGYRKEGDFNAVLPKSRLPEDEIFSFLP
ncbi:MAG: oxygen-insensitive NAD(P)H nitroreductase [Gammaproteobacteria bacterium]|nr:oxygen-insensitive NAD(P)H nitroreductase [Gammaproteobacteria bacterium]